MSDSYSRVAVLIPCLDEEVTVGGVVDGFRRALPGAVVYVYDNASSDSTALVAAAHGAFVVHEPRRGKGNVVRSMFRDIDADCYLMVDGDDTYPAEAAPTLVAPVLNGEADMVVGDRIADGSYAAENKRPLHGFGNALVRRAIKLAFGVSYGDVMTGYRAMSRDFVKTFPVLSDGFQVETELSVHAADHRMRVVDVPVAYRDRPEGSSSKLDTLSDGVRVLAMIASMFRDYRPMTFFSIAAALFLVVGLALGVPVVAEYMSTGLVERLPTAFLAATLVSLSALSLACGLVLDSVAKSSRRQWELGAYRAR